MLGIVQLEKRKKRKISKNINKKMAKELKSFIQFLSEKEEIKLSVLELSECEVKNEEATSEKEHTEKETVKEEIKKVSEMLKECYESAKYEAKLYAEDAHEEHTVETYMMENAALVASLSAESLKEMKEDLETEAYESALNQMTEAFTKKINQCKESYASSNAADIE
jgi:hypothetical protein